MIKYKGNQRLVKIILKAKKTSINNCKKILMRKKNASNKANYYNRNNLNNKYSSQKTK